VLASIFQGLGAIFLWPPVIGVIRGNVIHFDLYVDEPHTLMYGMFSALLSASVMLFLLRHSWDTQYLVHISYLAP
jgi:phosphate/sulfate permease